MPNIIDILARALSLRQETALNSITPNRAGGIMYDTLLVLNQMQLEGGSLLISKVYASVSAMEADTTPTSDLTGRALKPGQLVVIVTSDSSSSDMGSEYRFNGPGSWTYVGKVGGLPLDTVPTQSSTKGITSGGVYTALAAMKAEGYKYMGLATPGSGGTAPGTPNQPVFYIAGPGSYPNFGSITVASGYLGFIKYSSGSWSVESVAVGKDYDEQISQLEAKVDGIEDGYIIPTYTLSDGGITTNGTVASGTTYKHSSPIYVKMGQTVRVVTAGYAFCLIAKVVNSSYSPIMNIDTGDANIPATYTWVAPADMEISITVKSTVNYSIEIELPYINDLQKNMMDGFDDIKMGIRGITDKKSVSSAGDTASFPVNIKSGKSFRIRIDAPGVLKTTTAGSQMSVIYENEYGGTIVGYVGNGTELQAEAVSDISKLVLYVNTNSFLAAGDIKLLAESAEETIDEQIEKIEGLQDVLIQDKVYTLGTATNAYVKASDGFIVTGQSMYRLYYIDLFPGDFLNFKAAVPNTVAAISKYNGVGKNCTPLVIGRDASTPYEYNYSCKEAMTVAICWVNTTFSYINGYHSYIGEELYKRTPTNVEIVLPSNISVVVGHELTIYNDNIIRCDNIENYDIKWLNTGDLNARAYHEGLRLNPVSATASNVIVKVRDKFTFSDIATATVRIESISEPTLSDKKVVFIGDSLTHAAVYPAEVEVLSNGGITSLGTRSRSVLYNGETHTVAHEGRSGWYVSDYLTQGSKGGVTNPFYNPITQSFDFSYYISNNNIGSLNAVCICLGTNGFLENQDDVVSGINTMIDNIHTYDADLMVLVSLIIPPAKQDGWANINNTRTSSANEMLKLQMDLVKKYIFAFDGRNDNVKLVPWYVNVDREHDFPTTQVALSSRNPEVIVRENDNVHPGHFVEYTGYIELISGVGYLKMADSMYYELAKLFS